MKCLNILKNMSDTDNIQNNSKIYLLMIKYYDEAQKKAKIIYNYFGLNLEGKFLNKLNTSFCEEILNIETTYFYSENIKDITTNDLSSDIFKELETEKMINSIWIDNLDNKTTDVKNTYDFSTYEKIENIEKDTYINNTYDMNTNELNTSETNSYHNNTYDLNANENDNYDHKNISNIFTTYVNNIEIKCYESCEICEIRGNNITHNCLECHLKYPFKLKKNNYLNCYEFCHNNTYDEINNTYICLEEPICVGIQNKLIPEKNNLCIESCINNDKYKYEFRNICYESCPKEISKSSKENQYLCELNCTEEYPYENIRNQHCIKKCDLNEMFINKCKQNYINKNNDKKENLSIKIIENIKNGTMKEVLSQVVNNNETIFIKEGNSSHLISTLSSNLKRVDFSSINFGTCEKKIREENNIQTNEELILYEIEHNVEGFNIPIIEYVLFTEDGSNQLDLNICGDMKVQYYIPVSINESDLDKHDPSSEFYNNECNKHSTEGGVDMTLYDRKNEYNNNNMSLCEKNCTFNGIDPDTKIVVCDCNIKNDRTFNSEEIKAEDLLNQIDSQKSSSNLKVTQCINDVLEPEQIKSNSGFFLLLFILVIFIIVFIIFCIKGKRNLESKIDEIIYNKFEKEKKNKNKNDLNKNNKNK